MSGAGSMSTVKIYVVTHKNFNPICKSPYQVIVAGSKVRAGLGENVLFDNVGENISEKNPNYCELTALYWIWKNDTSSEIIGLCHYRRYLSRSLCSNSGKYILSEKNIQKYFKRGYDVILPYKPIARRTVAEIYCDCGYEKDLRLLRTIIEKRCPDYLKDYDLLLKRHSNYPANIMILSKLLLNQYAEWLFDLLFVMERENDISGYSAQEARIYGYLAERLLEVWVRKNKLKVRHFRMINTDEKRTLMGCLLDVGSVITTWMKNY